MIQSTRRQFVAVISAVAGFSAVSNILGLSSPLVVMLIYDRVLATGSIPTLVLIAGGAASALIVAGALDLLRGRILLKLSEFLEERTSSQTRWAVSRGLQLQTGEPNRSLDDLELLRNLSTGQLPGALMDAPWIPIYLAVTFAIHPYLGWLSVVLGMSLASVVLLGERAKAQNDLDARSLRSRDARELRALGRNADLARSMGMLGRITSQWEESVKQAAHRQRSAAYRQNGSLSFLKTLRALSQLVVLSTAAWLALDRQTTPGAIFASSLIVGRALHPVEMMAMHWHQLRLALPVIARILHLADAPLPNTIPLTFKPPLVTISVRNLYSGVDRSGAPIGLGDVNMDLATPEIVAIVGSVGSGKSLLARALVGAEIPVHGSIKINGIIRSRFDPDQLGRYCGWMPQEPGLLPGSIRDNVVRFETHDSDTAYVAALDNLGLHALINHRSEIDQMDEGRTSGQPTPGQRQLLSLARATWGSPSLLVLDQPEGQLDPDGIGKVENAILEHKGRGGLTVLVSHHPRLLRHADRVVVMAAGRITAIMSYAAFRERLASQPTDRS